MEKEKQGRGPEGVYSAMASMESRIRSEAEKRAKAMDERIIAEGYAERQIADTLSRVKPINTKL